MGTNTKKATSTRLANAALLAATLTILFGVLEIAVRLMERARQQAGRNTESWAIFDSDLGYRMRPNKGDVNADGLRDDPVEKPKRRFRILMLGDSVAYYGDTRADTFPTHVERVLQASPTLAPAEVLNAGVRGYTNYQELVYLRKYGVAFEPDLVGVAFVLNDLHRILHEFKVENGEIVGETYTFTGEAVQSVDSTLYRLAKKSHFLVWLREQLSLFDRLIELYAGDGFSFDYRPDFNTAWREDQWGAIERQLAEMSALGHARGFKLFLVAFPFGDQLRPDYLARNRAYVTYPQRKLAEITSRLGIPLLDLFDELNLKRDFIGDRIHLSKEGRAVAGKRIARFLVEQRLVPQQAPQASTTDPLR